MPMANYNNLSSWENNKENRVRFVELTFRSTMQIITCQTLAIIVTRESSFLTEDNEETYSGRNSMFPRRVFLHYQSDGNKQHLRCYHSFSSTVSIWSFSDFSIFSLCDGRRKRRGRRRRDFLLLLSLREDEQQQREKISLTLTPWW